METNPFDYFMENISQYQLRSQPHISKELEKVQQKAREAIGTNQKQREEDLKAH